MEYDLTNWMMVFVRVSALLSIFPVFTMRNFPIQLRLALGVLVAFLVAPMLPALGEVPSTLFGMVGLMGKEVGVGLMLGFVSRILFYLLEFAGGVISLEMSLSMASVVSPLTGSQNQIPGIMLFYLGATLFLTLDLHHWLLVVFQRSFELVPVGAARLSPALFTDLISRVSRLFTLGFLMAGPIVAVAFLINLVFSVLGRAVPQMNVFIESFAFRILSGLIVFGMTLNLMAQHIVNYLRRLPEDLLRVAQLLGGS